MTRSRIQFSHFPGGGPAGQTCRRCRYFYADQKRLGWGACAEAARKVRRHMSDITPIWDGTRACKDWRERV